MKGQCKHSTLMILINREALIKGEGGHYLKSEKRRDPNKRGGRSFFQNGEAPIKGEEGQIFQNTFPRSKLLTEHKY